jgi:DNA-binding phage protein
MIAAYLTEALESNDQALITKPLAMWRVPEE